MQIAASTARERVLEVAARLFQEHGLVRVTMRDVADALGMRQASLYHHAPGGKAQLYREVFERMIAHQRVGLERAIAAAGPDLRARLRAVSSWYGTQRPVYFLRRMTSDMPSLGDDEARALAAPAYAAAVGAIEPRDPDLLAGSFLAVLDGVESAEARAYGAADRVAMAHTMVDVLLDGLTVRA